MIEQLKKYDQLFSHNHSHGNEAANDVFCLTNRHSELILSAPHATASFTNKQEKRADLFTGALVQYLGEIENISTIIRQKFTPYKCLVSDYVAEQNLQDHYFLDIHGFNQDMDYDICLGTAQYEAKDYPYLDGIIEVAEKYHLKYIVNHPNYTGKVGLVGRYQEKFGKTNVIQIEFQKYLRDFYHHADTIENITIPFMRDVIRGYKKSPINVAVNQG